MAGPNIPFPAMLMAERERNDPQHRGRSFVRALVCLKEFTMFITEPQNIAIKRNALKFFTDTNLNSATNIEPHKMAWADVCKLSSVATREASNLAGVQAMFNEKGKESEDIQDAYEGLLEIVREAEKEKDIRSQEGSREPREDKASKAVRAKRPTYAVASSENGEFAEHTRAFSDWLRAPQSRVAQSDLGKFESRSANSLTGSAGGFVVPEIIAGPIASRARDANPMRDVVRVLEVASGDVVFPLSNADASSGWAGETDARTATTEPTLDGKVPSFGMNYAYVKMTEELANDAVLDVTEWFEREVGMALGESEMIAIISGDGVKKPKGLLNVPPEAGADGSRTADAFKFLPAAATAAFVADEALDLVYDLKARYRANGRWLMNSSTTGTLRKLKTADGAYLWQDSLIQGQPNTFSGYPVTICEAMEDVGAGNHPIAFGDFDAAYILALINGMTVTSADQSITEPGSNKLYVRQRVGGCVYDENAVRFLKMADV